MADNYLSGITGGVLIGGPAYSFKKWKLAMNTKMVIRNNFTVQGFQRLVAGFTKGTVTAEGPYNAGNFPIVCGVFYVFTLQWSANLAIVVTCGVQDLEPDDDAEDGPNVSITALSSGVFTAAIT